MALALFQTEALLSDAHARQRATSTTTPFDSPPPPLTATVERDTQITSGGIPTFISGKGVFGKVERGRQGLVETVLGSRLAIWAAERGVAQCGGVQGPLRYLFRGKTTPKDKGVYGKVWQSGRGRQDLVENVLGSRLAIWAAEIGVVPLTIDP